MAIEVDASDFANGAQPKADGSTVDTSLPQVSDNDFASGTSSTVEVGAHDFAEPKVPDTVVGEDLRRTKEYIGKVVDYGKDIIARQEIATDPRNSFVVQNGNPLSAAFNVAGWGLDQLQKHVGKHLAAGILKVAMRHDIPTSYQDVAIGEPQSKDSFNFEKRWQGDINAGGSALHDIRPTAQSPATPKEYLLRELLSTLGGDSIRLNEDEAKPALDAMSQDSIPVPLYGKVPITAILASTVHEIGGLPVFLLGTGVGARAVAAEREALQFGTATKLLSPKELVKATAKIQTAEVAIEGGVQGGIGAAKEGQDPGYGILGGAVFGGVLGKLASMHGAKSEVMGGKNLERSGLGLPPITFQQFLKEAGEVTNRSQAQVRKLGTVMPGAGLKQVRTELVEFGDPKAKHSFQALAQDEQGRIWVQNVKINVRSRQPQIVHQREVSGADLDEWEASGNIPNAYDPRVKLQVMEQIDVTDHKNFVESDLGSNKKNLSIGEKEEHIRWATNLVANETFKLDKLKQKPVIVSPDKVGDILITPVEDGALDDTVLSTPRVGKGDIVKFPNDEYAVVHNTSKDGVVLHNGSGQIVYASPHDFFKVNEPNLPNDLFKKLFGTVETAGPTPRRGLLTQNKLTIPRVMKATGADAVEAQHMLNDMVVAGQVSHDGNGNFMPAKSYVQPFDESRAGFMMYYGTGNDGKGKIGVLRGRDPKNQNNYLIEVGVDRSLSPIVDLDTGDRMGPYTSKQYAKAAATGMQPQDIYPKTRTVSVPLEEVRTLQPVLFGDAQKSHLPDQMGLTTPLPPDIVVTNQHVANLVQEAIRKNGQLNKLVSNIEAVKKAISNFFVNEYFHIPTDVRAKADKLQAATGSMKANTQAYQETFAAQLGGELSKNDVALVQKIKLNAARVGRQLSQREVEMAKFYNANPQYAGEVQATVDLTLARIKANNEELAKLGIPSIANLEAARAAGIEDEYTTNVYAKYLLARKDWTKFVQKQLTQEWSRAVKVVMERNPGIDGQGIEDYMLDVMGMDIRSEQERMKTAPNGDVKKNLKHRIEMHDAIEGIIGKVDSASVIMAHSLAATDSLLMRVKTWNEIHDTPYWSPGPRTDLGPHGGAVVPDSPIYGNARGGRVHESLRYLVEQKAPHQEGFQAFRAISSYWKFNVVPAGGFAPWVNNIMRNWKGTVLSGGIQSLGDLATFFDAANIMLEYKRNPILNGHNSLLTEAVANGAVSTGFAGNEISKNKLANRILGAVKKSKGNANNIWDIVSTLPKAMQGAAQDLGAAYDTIDRLFKFTSYLNIRRNGLAKGLSIDDASALATYRVKQSFPDYENIAPTLEKLRKGSVAAIAPFLSSKAEDMRINGQLIKRLVTEPDLVGRMIGAAGVFAGMYGLMRELRRANGITDQMVEKGLDEDKLSSQAFRPFSAIMPELDDKGRMVKADFTQWEDAFLSMQGHPMDMETPAGVLSSVVRDIVQGYFGDKTIGGAITDQAMSAGFNLHPLSPNNVPTWNPGENGVLTFMAYIAQHGGVPQLPIRINDANQRMNIINPINAATHEESTPAERNYKIGGLPLAGPVGIKSDTGRTLELDSNVKQVAKQILPAILNNNDQQHIDFLVKQKLDAMNALIQEFDQNHGKGK